MTCALLIALALALPAPGTKFASAFLRAPRVDPARANATALFAPASVQPKTKAPLGLPARVVDASNVQVTSASFPTFRGSGEQIDNTQWRIVNGTGNCCENYLAVSPQGTLFDFGGDYIFFSTDEGQSWKRVVPSDPLPNFGEGTIAVAHNGDIVGVAWNPYYGDRVVPFKYSAEDEGWFYTTTKLHQPFFDRESVAVIPGPFEFAGQRFPYLTVLRGGWPAKTPWFYSFDGLNYFVPNSRQADMVTEVIDKPLELKKDPMLDWIQPAEQAAITPLGGGRALARRADTVELQGQFSRLNLSTLKWARYEFPSGPLPEPGRLRVDSKARLHYIARKDHRFVYMLSTDGGRSWSEHPVQIPAGYEVADYETAVNGGLDLFVVTIHGRNEDQATNQDFVYKFSLRNDKPRLKTVYFVGDGKGDYSSAGITAPGDRFDFPTIVIMPNGKLALSFANSQTGHPTMAVEL